MNNAIDKLAAERTALALENENLKDRIKELELELRCSEIRLRVREKQIDDLYAEMGQLRQEKYQTLEGAINNLRTLYSEAI